MRGCHALTRAQLGARTPRCLAVPFPPLCGCASASAPVARPRWAFSAVVVLKPPTACVHHVRPADPPPRRVGSESLPLRRTRSLGAYFRSARATGATRWRPSSWSRGAPPGTQVGGRAQGVGFRLEGRGAGSRDVVLPGFLNRARLTAAGSSLPNPTPMPPRTRALQAASATPCGRACRCGACWRRRGSTSTPRRRRPRPAAGGARRATSPSRRGAVGLGWITAPLIWAPFDEFAPRCARPSLQDTALPTHRRRRRQGLDWHRETQQHYSVSIPLAKAGGAAAGGRAGGERRQGPLGRPQPQHKRWQQGRTTRRGPSHRHHCLALVRSAASQVPRQPAGPQHRASRRRTRNAARRTARRRWTRTAACCWRGP
jgi:hypothetical protein